MGVASAWAKSLRNLWYRNTMLVVLIGLLVLGAIASKGVSVEPSNVINVLFQTTIVACVAIGQTVVMLTGGIDLTVGGMVVLEAVILGATTSTQNTSMIPHIGLVPGVFLGIAVAVVIGGINGTIVGRTRVPAFIATMAMMLVVTGLSFLLTRGVPVYDMSPLFADFGRLKLAFVPYAVISWMALMLVVHFVLSRTRLGPLVYAVGGSEKTARLSGVAVPSVKLVVYVLSSLMAAVGGFFLLVRTYIIIPSATAGSDYLMDPIAVVVVGGIALSGGKGTLKDAFIGVLVLAFLGNLMDVLLFPPAFQVAVKGLAIILAVMANTALSRRR